MSTINLEKIDKFYFALFGVMVLLTVIVIFTFQTVFSSLVKTYEVEVDTNESEMKVNREALQAAYEFIFNPAADVPDSQSDEDNPDIVPEL